jgi:hypothetical protein
MEVKMSDADLGPITDVREYVDEVKRNRPQMDMGGHGHRIESVREDDYLGHHIVVRTRYEIEVDGRHVTGHLGVTNDGRVHYHAVPNLSFPSAIAMVRCLIDAFPDDFTTDGAGNGKEGS